MGRVVSTAISGLSFLLFMGLGGKHWHVLHPDLSLFSG